MDGWVCAKIRCKWSKTFLSISPADVYVVSVLLLVYVVLTIPVPSCNTMLKGL